MENKLKERGDEEIDEGVGGEIYLYPSDILNIPAKKSRASSINSTSSLVSLTGTRQFYRNFMESNENKSELLGSVILGEDGGEGLLPRIKKGGESEVIISGSVFEESILTYLQQFAIEKIGYWLETKNITSEKLEARLREEGWLTDDKEESEEQDEVYNLKMLFNREEWLADNEEQNEEENTG